MVNRIISGGVVHELPKDLREVLSGDRGLLDIWEGLTELARNEWICWIEDAKREETREKRINRTVEDLMNGKKRPCCWPGCSHR